MDSEERTQVFIVRIWGEHREIERASPEWRGMIEHVPTGQQRYFRHLDDLITFILPYLERMGVKFGLRWRLRQWLRL